MGEKKDDGGSEDDWEDVGSEYLEPIRTRMGRRKSTWFEVAPRQKRHQIERDIAAMMTTTRDVETHHHPSLTALSMYAQQVPSHGRVRQSATAQPERCTKKPKSWATSPFEPAYCLRRSENSKGFRWPGERARQFSNRPTFPWGGGLVVNRLSRLKDFF